MGERQGRMGPAVMGLDTQPPPLQVHRMADVHADGLERCLGFGNIQQMGKFDF